MPNIDIATYARLDRAKKAIGDLSLHDCRIAKLSDEELLRIMDAIGKVLDTANVRKVSSGKREDGPLGVREGSDG